ncbi:MAG: hypothetical protein C7B44_05300 [Sulfobacillus thermosulfidooxidans]|nr:MAG: hypothetical protein C7B44_05300 [Sulfobacillus thermosulfidooxidans]
MPEITAKGREVVVRGPTRSAVGQALETRCTSMLSGWRLHRSSWPLLSHNRPYIIQTRIDKDNEGSVVILGGENKQGIPLQWGPSEEGGLRLPVLGGFASELSGAVFDVTDRLRLTERPRILYLGTYQDGAGLTTFLKAVRSLVSSQGEVIFLDGSAYRAQLAPVVGHMGLAQRAIFAPTLTPAEREALYQSADLIVYADQKPGQLFGLLDAYAAGLPAMVADTPVSRQMVGYPALLTDPAKPEIWAEGIQELLENHRLREQLVARAWEFVMPHRLPQVFEGWRQAIEEFSGGTLQSEKGAL